MALLGEGLLAIWNGMENGFEAEFLRWHVNQHIPERLGVEGFLRGRRYRAVDGWPRYFNFYEVRDVGVLQSPSYVARLNAPTDWTRAVVSHFTDTSRTLCRVHASAGVGLGAFVEAICFASIDPSIGGLRHFVEDVAANPDLVAAHVLVRDEDGKPRETSENKLRKAPDTSWAAILLVEACSAEALITAREDMLSPARLLQAGLPVPAKRGIYQLEYSLSADDLTSGQARIRETA